MATATMTVKVVLENAPAVSCLKIKRQDMMDAFEAVGIDTHTLKSATIDNRGVTLHRYAGGGTRRYDPHLNEAEMLQPVLVPFTD